MIVALSHRLTGFVVISVKGENDRRFINLCIKNGIRFWNYRRAGDAYVLSLRISDYLRLRPLRRRCPVRIKLVAKKGLPFRLKPIKKRPGLVAGFFAAAALYFFLAGQVWVLSVTGAGVYSEGEILRAAQSAGVYIGAGQKAFDPDRAAQKIMLALPELEWATVNTDGCRVEVAVRHSRKKPPLVKEEGVQNLVATRTGVVRFAEAQSGMLEVQPGQAVQPGDVLITGVWDSNRGKQDWELVDDPLEFTAAARGKVMAETLRRFTAKMPKEETVYTDGAKAYRFELGFFGLRIPFTPSFVSPGQYRRKTEQKDLYLLGTKLPLWAKAETLTRLYPEKRPLTPQAAQGQLDRALEQILHSEIAPGDSILEKKPVIYAEEKGFYTATLDCVCLENIGKTQQIMLK